MLAHTKMHLTEKNSIKTKIRHDISAFKKYLKIKDAGDLNFIREIQKELESLIHEETDNISSEEIFKDLNVEHTKAGALLKGLRIREGLSQAEFAKVIDTTQANLSSMENGKRPIGKNKARLIGEKFDVDYRYFL